MLTLRSVMFFFPLASGDVPRPVDDTTRPCSARMSEVVCALACQIDKSFECGRWIAPAGIVEGKRRDG